MADAVNTALNMHSEIKKLIELMDFNSIQPERKIILEQLAGAIKLQLDSNGEANITFICTHNSRRSQMAQVWTTLAAKASNVVVNSFSGGTEETAVAPQVLHTFQSFGFDVKTSAERNGIHELTFANNGPTIKLHSKVFNDSENPQNNFIAAMTCSDADENCPIVHGCSHRIALTYNDPKLYDGSILESTMYQYEAFKIGTEILYAFSTIKK